MKVVRLIKVCFNEMYSNVYVGIDAFPIQDSLKQDDTSTFL